MALKKIESVQRFNLNEKRYLSAYAENMLNEYDEQREAVDHSGIELEQIPHHLRDKFPLINHPKWSKQS